MIRVLLISLLFSISPVWADDSPLLIEWDSPAGRELRARMAANADYWQLSPSFTVQETQSFCGVASAVTALNALPVTRPVDPAYAPYAYFTQRNFFSPAVSQKLRRQTVLIQGITRAEMADALRAHGTQVRVLPGDQLPPSAMRNLLQGALLDDGQFVLANYSRETLHQVGNGHWSLLAAFDEQSDRVLILDVAKYKYPPVWVPVSALSQAVGTLDTTSGAPRGLVLVRAR